MVLNRFVIFLILLFQLIYYLLALNIDENILETYLKDNSKQNDALKRFIEREEQIQKICKKLI